MNENTIKNISNKEFPVFTALRSLITDINFINIGTIKKVHDENYVDVVLYYKTELGEETVIPAVRLLHIGTTKCKLKIVPAVGDNVLLLCPKDFIETIEYHRQAEMSKKSTLPYSDMNMCGILIREESDDNVKTEVTVDENGNVSVNTEGNISVDAKKIGLNGDGNSFVTWTEFNTKMQTLFNIFNTHTHVCASPGNPSAVPVPVIADTDLSSMKSTTVLLGDSAS